MNTNKQFTIDFFELMFLSETTISSQAIARSKSFDDLSDVHYHNMNEQQRLSMFNYVQKHPNFSLENEQCRHFFARFNPKNQYLVGCFHLGKAEKIVCYRFDEKYRTSKDRFVNEKYIKSIVRIHDNLVIK